MNIIQSYLDAGFDIIHDLKYLEQLLVAQPHPVRLLRLMALSELGLIERNHILGKTEYSIEGALITKGLTI